MKEQAIKQKQAAPRIMPKLHPVAARAASGLHDEKQSCVCGGGCPGCRDSTTVQAKHGIGAPDDRFEREADRVARDIVSAPASRVPISRAPSGMRRRTLSHAASASNTASDAGVPQVVQDALRSPGHSLDRRTLAFMEPRFRHDFRDVRVHTGPSAARSATAINAMAYTAGSHIVFGQGYYAPQTDSGRRLLTHELTHTIQQKGASEPQIQRAEVCDDAGICQSEADPELDYTPNVEPLAGASLLPPGDCSYAEQRALQDDVNASCKRERRCTQNDDCSVLMERIEANAACIKARATINARCFRGGDPGHTIAVAGAVGALGNCWLVHNRKCEPKPPFVPVPIPVPVEKMKPVVDKTFMERMAALTGLTGAALVLYIIVSEGSRIIPARNLIPAP